MFKALHTTLFKQAYVSLYYRFVINSLKFFKFILLTTGLFLGMGAKAQNSLPLFTMDRIMLDATNAQHLADVLRNVPFLNRYIKSNEVVSYSGVMDIQFVAIYKNNFPLLMDQNLGYDLRSIPLWDIDSLAVFLSDINNWNKNNGGLVLHLYTKDFVKKPHQFSLSATPTSLGDINANLRADFSNAKHSVSVGTNRSFESEMHNNHLGRQTPWASSQRYDANIRYKYYILPTVTLNLNWDNSWQNRIIKDDVIAKTTRVRDIEQKFSRSNYFGSLSTALSKNHTLVLNGQYHQFTATQFAIDKDLSSQKQEISNVTTYLDTLGYGQGWMQLLLKANFDKFGYTVGLDITTTTDHVHRTINAVNSAYSDYSLFGLFHYKYKEAALIQAGSKLLTNSLSGSYFLPQAKITFAPEQLLHVNVSYIRSLAYPAFSQVFYPEIFTASMPNNLLLKPILLNSVHTQLVIQKNAFELQTGIMFTQQTNLVVSTIDGYYNAGKSAGTYTYFNLKYMFGDSYIKPNIILHGISPPFDSINRIFFYPELNLYANWNIRKWHTNVIVASRFLGKYTEGQAVEKAAQITEIGGSKLLDIAVSKKFLSDKMRFLLGVNNVFNTTFVQQNTYELQQFDRKLLAENEIIQDRGLYFFTKIGYTF